MGIKNDTTLFGIFSLQELTLLRESFVNWYWCQLRDEHPKALSWESVFNPPNLTDDEWLAGYYCSKTCLPCRIQVDPRTRDLIRWVFDMNIKTGVHPRFGNDLPAILNDLEEAEKEALNA